MNNPVVEAARLHRSRRPVSRATGLARTTVALLVAAPLLSGAAWSLNAAEDQEPIDRQLKDRLIADPIDEDVQRELFGPDDATAKPAPADDREQPSTDGQSLTDELARQLGPAAVPEEGNPLVEIARKMRQAEGRIVQADSGPKTQTLQAAVVASLDELIKQARKQCKQSAPSQSKPQGVASRQPIRQPQQQKKPDGANRDPRPKPVSDPNASAGQSEPAEADREEAIRGLLRELWGELPQTKREQMLELPVEELFLPKYELLIEEYFKRLSEQEPADARAPLGGVP